MDSPVSSSSTSSSVAKPPGVWKRVAVGLGVGLLGYLVVAYLILPQVWKTYARHRPSFDDNPRLTLTGDGHPGDAINVALIGTERQLVAIMQAAHWYPADRLGLRSDLRIGVDTVLKRAYDDAPVSRLYLDGRPEDFAFEQPVGDAPRHRHHVRFWRYKKTDQGRPIWIGAATYDERVGLSHTTGQITHHTAADIDSERGHVINTLRHMDGLAETYNVPDFHTQREGKNGGGDRWYTDGALSVAVIKASYVGAGDVASKSVASHGEAAALTERALHADHRALKSSSDHLQSIRREMDELAKVAPWGAQGFFDAEQHDHIEDLLFRFLACRNTLWHLANYRPENDKRFSTDEAEAKRSAISFDAGFRLILHDALLVQAFRGDSVAIAKLNEGFYRSRIPANTYDRLLDGVTNEVQLSTLRDSFLLYTEESAKPDSGLAQAVRENSVYGDLIASTKTVASRADAIVQKLVETASLLPTLDNRLRHTRVAELLSTSEIAADKLLDAARAHLFRSVSRIKNPDAHLIKFSPRQKRQLMESLQTGDIILTYTAGYISDVFIPGAFKHAITYVGTVADRQTAGLTAENLRWVPDVERNSLLKDISTNKLASGESADVIEAVGEGVIFNHLGHLMDTHINRLVVLRPQVSPEERSKALAEVFQFLGDGYDFKFDFAEASEQVCTEVVYRAFNGKGSIAFSLVPRAGHPTLSADDIVNSFLAKPGNTFEFVLFADESPESSQHQARILTGRAGITALSELMAAQKD